MYASVSAAITYQYSEMTQTSIIEMVTISVVFKNTRYRYNHSRIVNELIG